MFHIAEHRMFVLMLWRVRELMETSHTLRFEPRHASVALSEAYVQLGFMAIMAALAVLCSRPMDSSDAENWCPARP